MNLMDVIRMSPFDAPKLSILGLNFGGLLRCWNINNVFEIVGALHAGYLLPAFV